MIIYLPFYYRLLLNYFSPIGKKINQSILPLRISFVFRLQDCIKGVYL